MASDRHTWRVLRVHSGPWRLWFPGMFHARVAVYLWLRRLRTVRRLVLVGGVAVVLEPPHDSRRYSFGDVRESLSALAGYGVLLGELVLAVVVVAVVDAVVPAVAPVIGSVLLLVLTALGLVYVVASAGFSRSALGASGIRSTDLADAGAADILRRRLPVIAAVLRRTPDGPPTGDTVVRQVGALLPTGVVIDRRQFGGGTLTVDAELEPVSADQSRDSRYLIAGVPRHLLAAASADAAQDARLPTLELRRYAVALGIGLLFWATLLAGPGDLGESLTFPAGTTYWTRWVQSLAWELDTLLGTDLTSLRSTGAGILLEVILRLGWLVLLGLAVNVGSQLVERRRILAADVLAALSRVGARSTRRRTVFSPARPRNVRTAPAGRSGRPGRRRSNERSRAG